MRNKNQIVVFVNLIAVLAFSVTTVCTSSAPTQTTAVAITEESTHRSNRADNEKPKQDSSIALLDVRAFCVSGQSLFAGTYESGMFRSKDNGESWIPVNAGLTTALGRPAPCILSLVVSAGCIFAGTGYDQGIFLSTDNGESWTMANAGLPFKYPRTLLDIPALIVHNNAIFAGSDCGGISISTDTGKNWKDASCGLASYESSGYIWMYGATSFIECGGDLFAATYGGVFRLTHTFNGGIQWAPVNCGLEGSGLYVIELAQQEGSIFAATLGGVYRSSNKGASWKYVSSNISDNLIESVFASQNSVFASTQYSTFVSKNNGANWTEIKSGLYQKDVRAFFQSGNTIFAGTQIDGVFRSSDSGKTWTACDNVL